MPERPLCSRLCSGSEDSAMVQILQFVLPDQTFDADATAALIAAYGKAIKELHDRGQPELVCEVIAKRIIAATAAGAI